MKKFLLKLLLNKRQREIIWQAMIFSEYTYRRRGNVDDAAVVQTVINEIQSAFVKDTYSKKEVDYIVAQVIKDTRAEYEKQIKDAFRNGVDSCKKELETAYKKGVDDTMAKIATFGIIVSKIKEDDAEQEQEEEQKQDSSEGGETEGQETTTGDDSQESEQEGQTTEEQEEKKE